MKNRLVYALLVCTLLLTMLYPSALSAPKATPKPELTEEEQGYAPASQLLEADGESIIFNDPTIAKAMEEQYPQYRNEDGSYPVSSLTNVVWLKLICESGTDLDLAELQFFVRLFSLDIENANKVTSVRSISNAQRMYNVYLTNVQEIDLTALVESTPLAQFLRIYNCGPIDLSPLAAYQEQLYAVELGGDNITDIDFLVDTSKLRNVVLADISNNLDLSPLLEKTNLTDITLKGNAAQNDIAWQIIANNTKLTRLGIDGQAIAAAADGDSVQGALPRTISIPEEALSKLGSLKQLHLSGVTLQNFDVFSKRKKLANVSLQECLIEDLSSLGKLPGLKLLTMTGMNAEGLATVKSLKTLTRLELNQCENVMLPAAKALSKLKMLNIQDCGLEDVSLVSGMSLNFLWLNNNKITDITPLTSAKAIVNLSLSGNDIQDYEPLAKVKKMKMVQCSEGALLPELKKVTINLADLPWDNFI